MSAGKRSVKVIGLTGGIAAGKSTVAKLFARLGAVVIDADEIAKEVLCTPEVAKPMREAWGDAVFGTDGCPDRARIADKVFGDAARLKQLTGWVHPPTIREMRERLEKAKADPAVRMVIIDAPLLVEGELHTWCDRLVFVEAPAEARARRAGAARGWADGELARREAHQASLEQKRRRADAVIRNDGEESETFEQVQSLFEKWMNEPWQ